MKKKMYHIYPLSIQNDTDMIYWKMRFSCVRESILVGCAKVFQCEYQAFQLGVWEHFSSMCVRLHFSRACKRKTTSGVWEHFALSERFTSACWIISVVCMKVSVVFEKRVDRILENVAVIWERLGVNESILVMSTKKNFSGVHESVSVVWMSSIAVVWEYFSSLYESIFVLGKKVFQQCVWEYFSSVCELKKQTNN